MIIDGISIFYTEKTRKVDLWSFFMSENLFESQYTFTDQNLKILHGCMRRLEI